MSRLRYSLDDTVYSVDTDGSGDLEQDVRIMSHADADNYDNRPPEPLLPSMGQENDSCGDEHVNFCSGCGSTHAVGQSCGRALCPRDYAKWAVERSTTAISKIEERRKIITQNRSGHSPKFHHIVVSMEQIRFAREDAEAAMYELAKYLISDVLRTEGGILAYHPYRGKDGDDRGAWKGRIGQDTDWAEVEDELKHSEHVHAMVLADTVDYYTCEAIHNETGIPVHRIEKDNTDDSHVSLYGISDLARATSYCLSHVGVVEGENASRACTRYFGSVAQTAAGEQTEAQAHSEVREVANTTLGVGFSDLSCTRDLDEGEDSHQHAAADARNAGADGSGEDNMESQICGGRLLDITMAPRFLEDEEWVEKASCVDELRAAWKNWRQEHDPPP